MKKKSVITPRKCETSTRTLFPILLNFYLENNELHISEHERTTFIGT